MKDFTHDNSLSFLALLKQAGVIPEWLNEVPDAGDVAGLPSVAFADPSHRLFPMHTKAAAFLSAVSAYVYDHPGEAWKERIKVACHAYHITDAVKVAHAALAPAKQAAAVAPPLYKFATHLTVEPGGPAVGYYPITTPSQIEASALKLATDMAREALPASWFCEAAEALVKEAAAQGVASALIPAAVLELGESRLPSAGRLAEQLSKRASAVTAEAANLYKEAAEAVLAGEMTAMDGAHFWEMADRRFGVKYANFTAPPVEVFRAGRTYAQLQKEAAAAVLVADVVLPYAQLQGLPDRLVASLFEKQAAAVVLAAMDQSDGLAATAKLASLAEPDQLALLQLLLESADGTRAA